MATRLVIGVYTLTRRAGGKGKVTLSRYYIPKLEISCDISQNDHKIYCNYHDNIVQTTNPGKIGEFGRPGRQVQITKPTLYIINHSTLVRNWVNKNKLEQMRENPNKSCEIISIKNTNICFD